MEARQAEKRRSRARPCWLAFSIFVLHVSLAGYYGLIRGVSIHVPVIRSATSNTWDWYWQLVPMQDLQARFVESIWNLHAQPPLYNAYGALVGAIAGNHLLTALHALNVLAGGGICAMTFAIVRSLTGAAWFAWCVAAVVALQPSFFLYEAHPLYTIATAFLVTMAVYWCTRMMPAPGSRYSRSGQENTAAVRYASLAIGTFSALVLTRSSFHLVLLLPVAATVSILARKRWKRALIVSMCISLLPLGWYVKNSAQYGFFGASSWFGLGLWKTVVYQYPLKDGRELLEDGVVTPMVAFNHPFSGPDTFRTYGYDKTSTIPTLSRNDYHNINVPDISRTYRRNALKVIAHKPGLYWRNVRIAYDTYACPSSAFEQLRPNAARMREHIGLWNDWIYGKRLATELGQQILGRPVCSMLYFALPAGLILYAIAVAQKGRLSLRRWKTVVREDGAMILLAVTLTYALLVGSLFEIRENARFKFEVEALIAAFLSTLVYRSLSKLFPIWAPSPTGPEIDRG